MRRCALQSWSPPEAALVERDFLEALSVPVLGQPCVSLASTGLPSRTRCMQYSQEDLGRAVEVS